MITDGACSNQNSSHGGKHRDAEADTLSTDLSPIRDGHSPDPVFHYGPVKHGASNERATTTLIGAPGDDERYRFGKTPAFATP